MNTSGRLYKIRLTSGRIIGPIDFHRVQLLILKNHITGAEVGRIYPQGDWVDVNLISEIAETFILKISGKLEKILKDELTDVGFQTQINQVTKLLTEAQNAIQIPEGTLTEVEAPEDADLGKITPEKMPIQPILPVRPIWDETQTTGSKTFFDIKDEEKENITLTQLQIAPENLPEVKKISDEKTIVFQKQSKPFFSKTMTKQKTNKFFIYLLFGAGVFLFVEDLIRKETPTPIINKPRIIRPILPHFAQSKPDPLQSEQIYNQTLKDYLEDTVEGYKSAADKLLKAVELDPENVKALALLASSYLNLIDSSNKEENYFKVISTLIDMSRVKAADLQETVIADVEFFVNVHQPEAAQNRIVEYVKTHKTYDLILFYYISYSAFHRGDLHGAVNYLSKIPDTNVFSSKVFYLRGLIYEKFGNFDDAFLEYQKAIRLNKNHAKSYLKIAELLWNNGKIQSAQKYIEFVIQHANFLSPKDLAKGYYLSAIFYEQLNNWNYALASIEKAVFFESDNADYLLEIYTLRARAGESIKAIQQEARMYYFLGEGQKLLKQGQYHEALTFFLRARESNLDSAMPLIKIKIYSSFNTEL
ncbi:MAG: tetratricopeptide repeat protein [Deltaproteobacteria bacterium]|nr:tetratricopeptide repeat protein [Deltaproteobacteria bacterium]